MMRQWCLCLVVGTRLLFADWSLPEDLSMPMTGTQTPVMASGGTDLSIVAWQANDAIYASSFVDGVWTDAVLVSSDYINSNILPSVAVNGAGQATLVWIGDSNVLYASQSLNGGSWSTPVAVATNASSSFPEVSVVIDEAGFSTVLWNSTTDYVFASQADFGDSWSAPEQIGQVNTASQKNIRAAVSPTGVVLAVWIESTTFKTKYNNQGMGWSSVDQFSSGTPTASESSIAVAGNLIIYCWQQGNTNGTIYLRAFNYETLLWNPDFPSVTSDLSVSASPIIIPFSSGAGWLAWVATSSPFYGPFTVEAAPFDTSLVFGSIVEIGNSTNTDFNSNAIYGTCPKDGGGFIGTVLSNMGAKRAYVSLLEDGAWGDFQAVSTLSTQYNTPVTSASSGLSFMAWQIAASPPYIQAIFNGDFAVEIDPPSFLRGEQIKNNFGLYFELSNKLIWGASPSEGVDHYEVYRGGEFLAAVPSTQLEYEDHNRNRKESTVYSVFAANEDGDISDPVIITLP